MIYWTNKNQASGLIRDPKEKLNSKNSNLQKLEKKSIQ